MHSPSGAVYSAAQVRDLDRRAIGVFGIEGYELMCRAGAAALDALCALWPGARTITVLCGPGNNGGDGYVVARLARSRGLGANVVPLGDPRALTGDAGRAYQDYTAEGGRCGPWSPALLEADVIVDALFGTGLARPVSDEAAAMIEGINAAGRPILAVDVPSGLHADTGAVLGLAVHAEITVTFIGRKQGLYVGEGLDHAGRVILDDLGVPAACFDGSIPVGRLIGEDTVLRALPRRARTSHKGNHGHVLVIGGGPGMPGAARLAGEAALRAGAGLVTLAVHVDNAMIAATRPELMCVGVESPAELAALLGRATVVAAGPGLGQGTWADALVNAAIDGGLPLVVDADALNWLAAHPRSCDHWVLTPHPGEAARLLGSTAAAVQADRLAAARELQRRYGGVAVLKGAGTIVYPPGGPALVCDRGNPGMAVGGMGDVLTGLIAGVAAQCGDLALAAQAGVFVHAQAGDLASRAGERGMLASDVLRQVRACVNPACE
jgi:ADP-dependent NAD(P)H-hydrate dehydratase / NAD(P)H-hydrate epimerase